MKTLLPIRLLPLVLASAFLIGCTAEGASIPLEHLAAHPSVLRFGMYVTSDPARNPIDPPERFEGYHVGTDFEISQEELHVDVPVFALCSGEVIYSGFAEGYGGLLVHRCTMQEEPVTVMYGHLSFAGLPEVGTTMEVGQKIGVLAPARTHESDGNRKHLHIGVHRGEEIDVRGYVQTEEEIAEFIDPFSLIPTEWIESLLTPKHAPYWQTMSGSTLAE